MDAAAGSADLVPVIDIAPFHDGDAVARRAVAAAFDRACRDIGFVVVAGHGVPEPLIDGTLETMRAYFALPLDAKQRTFPPAKTVQRGYLALGVQAAAYTLGAESPPDLYERFRMGPVDVPDDSYHRARRELYYAPNIWPRELAGMPETLTGYYRAMETLAATLMRIFALALDLPEGFFDAAIDRHVTTLAVNHYPAQTAPPLPGQLRAGAHSDYGNLTILKAEDVPGGLQVRDRSGAWRDVTPVPGTFIVNIGDLMAQWTNDRWVSTVHRVINPPADVAANSARLSVAFFHQPNEDFRIECLPSCCSADNPAKYPPTSSGEHLQTKLRRQRELSTTA
jgi:isopenicillin N synthase-like dioxygenase